MRRKACGMEKVENLYRTARAQHVVPRRSDHARDRAGADHMVESAMIATDSSLRDRRQLADASRFRHDRGRAMHDRCGELGVISLAAKSACRRRPRMRSQSGAPTIVVEHVVASIGRGGDQLRPSARSAIASTTPTARALRRTGHQRGLRGVGKRHARRPAVRIRRRCAVFEPSPSPSKTVPTVQRGGEGSQVRHAEGWRSRKSQRPLRGG